MRPEQESLIADDSNSMLEFEIRPRASIIIIENHMESVYANIFVLFLVYVK